LAKINLWIGLIFGVIIYFAMIVYGGYEEISAAVSSFNLPYLPILLGLAFTNYLLRGIKWHYFFKTLHLDMSFKENLWVFFSGLLMAITPAKLGEVWKSWMCRDIRGYDLHRTMPAVFMDRVTDVVAMLTLASFGVFTFRMSILSFSLVVTIFLAMLIVLRSTTIMLMILGTSRRFEDIRKAYMGSRNLLNLKPLILAVLISVVAWFMECLAFYLTFRGLSVQAGLFESTFIYSISSIAGALTMLPGGLGVTDATLAGLSTNLLTLDRSTAVAATLIIRIVTLWFAVGVGFISYFVGRRRICQKSA
jgi:uncharacterized membrane protein YbhN (UPF0104 family)